MPEGKYNCECGGKYTFSNKRKHINSLTHYNYMEASSQNAKIIDRVFCPCGGKFTQCGRDHHYDTKKHQKYMLDNNITTNPEYGSNK